MNAVTWVLHSGDSTSLCFWDINAHAIPLTSNPLLARVLHQYPKTINSNVMRKILSYVVVLTMMVCIVVGCSKRGDDKWSDENRKELRKELDTYREMVYLDNLNNMEFDDFSYGVVDAIEVDYPIYTTFIEMPGRGDTLEVYVVSTIVEELRADAHNMRNIYPYPQLVAEGVLPSGLSNRAQRAFYECFARKVDGYFPSVDAFFNAILADTLPTSTMSQFQRDCASTLFDWDVEVDETIILSD